MLKRFRKIWVWVFCIASVLFLLSSNPGSGPGWSPAEQVIVEVTAPFQKVITGIARRVQSLWRDYFYLVGVREENRKLRRALDALTLENNRYRELLTTHQRLQELLRFKQSHATAAVAAQVIGVDPSGWFKSVIIDKGTRDGLRVDMPVVSSAGVVGKTVTVSPDYAKVLLIIDQNSAVDALVQRSRDRGMVKGLAREFCRLDYVLKSTDVKTGDLVITSGLGGVFPKGLALGRILTIRDAPGELFREIVLETAVDFSKLEEVLVVLEGSQASAPLSEKP